jgi:hypothetical protein
MQSNLVDASYAVLWGFSLLCSIILGRALYEAVSFGNEVARNKPIDRIPDFSLPLFRSGDNLTNRDVKGVAATFMFATLLGTQVTAPREHLLLSIRVLLNTFGGRLYLVCTGGKEESEWLQFETLVELKDVVILLDPAGLLAKKLKVKRAPAAFIFDGRGRFVKSGYMGGEE